MTYHDAGRPMTRISAGEKTGIRRGGYGIFDM